MRDPVYRSFLRRAAEDVRAINADSDRVRLAADTPGELCDRYAGHFSGIEHLECSAADGVRVTSEPISFALFIPEDYLRSTDPNLQFRVARAYSPVLHPNIRGSLVCLGEGFFPGTPLRALVEQLHLIFSSHVFATQDALSIRACDQPKKNPWLQ